MRKTILILVFVFSLISLCKAEVIFKSDFSKGDFADLGWIVKGDWDIFKYGVKNDPGPVARYPTNKPDGGTLTKKFEEVKDPQKLVLSFDYGWGWGSEDQGADSVSIMLLDSNGDGYIFTIGRWKAKWCFQWGIVKNGVPPKERKWAPEDMDFTLKSIRDPNFEKLGHVIITREKGGNWIIKGENWNKWQGGTVKFSDNTVSSFSQVVLYGTKNFDEQVFNNIVLDVTK
jgi:hypothetical protein